MGIVLVIFIFFTVGFPLLVYLFVLSCAPKKTWKEEMYLTLGRLPYFLFLFVMYRNTSGEYIPTEFLSIYLLLLSGASIYQASLIWKRSRVQVGEKS